MKYNNCIFEVHKVPVNSDDGKPRIGFLVTEEVYKEYKRILGKNAYRDAELSYEHLIICNGPITYLEKELGNHYIDCKDCNVEDLIGNTSKIPNRVYSQ